MQQLDQPSFEQTPPDNFNSLALGAGLIVTIGVIPYMVFINSCCLGMIGAGVLSLWHYTSTHSLTLSRGEGFKLGALTGLLGGLSLYAVQLLLLTLFDYQPGTEEVSMVMTSFLQDNPEALAEFEKSMREAKEDAFSIKNIMLGVLSAITIYPIFTGVGGAIGASLFAKGNA